MNTCWFSSDWCCLVVLVLFTTAAAGALAAIKNKENVQVNVIYSLELK